MEGRIWLIGGTSESEKIAGAIARAGLPCTVTVTTNRAKALYLKTPELKIRVGQIKNDEEIDKFCRQEQIVAVVDASHPYATEISQRAIARTALKNIPYLRFERPELENGSSSIELDSFERLLSGNYLQGQRALLTIGYKSLPLFKSWHDRATLFARVLPVVESLQLALDSGFPPDRIIALRPPIAMELEKALWQQWQISLAVTKASGREGGEEVKRSVSEALNVPLIIIARPRMSYPRKTSNLFEAIAFCQKIINPPRVK